MAASIDHLAQEALELPPDQRLVLAQRLLDSVESEPEPGAEEAWDAEIGRRIARFEAGESQPISTDEVFAALRRIAPGR